MSLFIFYLLVVVLGILSMGFQMLASRLLSPHFGSTIIVWAWLVTTFLAAFSTGSILGGLVSKLPSARRVPLQIGTALLAVVSLAVISFRAGAILTHIELTVIPDVRAMNDPDLLNKALFISCFGLFFVPVTMLSSFGPQCVGWLAARGQAPGAASGLVYGVSTLGNIAGVMLTTFVLLPHFGVTALLFGWLGVAVLSLSSLICILRTAPLNSAK